MKSYREREHSNCRTKHRTDTGLARCLWPRAEWIGGSGEFALLARCRVLTITIWDSAERAEREKKLIDETGCGGDCTGDHEIVLVQR